MFEALIDGGGVETEDYGLGQPYQPCPGLFNPGVDIAAPCGRTTRAIGYGTVLSVGAVCWAGPHSVVIRSGDVDILYAHQSNHYVSDGQQVERGSAVGAIGSMHGNPGEAGCYQCANGCPSRCGGVATGPHIHWQVNPAGIDFTDGYCRGINPFPYLVSWPGQPPIPPPPPAPAGPAPEYGLTLEGALIALAGVSLGAYVVHDSLRKLALKGKLGSRLV